MFALLNFNRFVTTLIETQLKSPLDVMAGGVPAARRACFEGGVVGPLHGRRHRRESQTRLRFGRLRIPHSCLTASWDGCIVVPQVLYAQRDPSVAALVLDSTFSRFNDLAIELVETYASMNSVWLPRAMIKVVLGFFKRSVKQHTGTDIDRLDVIAAAATSFIPVQQSPLAQCALMEHRVCTSQMQNSYTPSLALSLSPSLHGEPSRCLTQRAANQ